MKSVGEIMEIWEAFDLTGSFRDAGELAGCSHHTVKHYVGLRAAGGVSAVAAVRPLLIDGFLPKLEEWMEHSGGKVRADVAHQKLLLLGFRGSERTTRRAVASVRAAFKAGRVRVHRPWVTEPGMWLQYDFGDGPLIGGARATLFCLWLAWSRFRVVLAIRDKSMPSVIAALDVALRRLGGVPTYALTDNEKTVTIDHVAGIAVRNPRIVAFARHYGLTVHTCEPADPASKGGSESTVKLAKADLVPTETNLLPCYGTFAELEQACEAFCELVNARVHRVTRRTPVQMLGEERARLHPLPPAAHTVAFGVTRTVARTTPMVTYEHCQYSVPHRLLDQVVWVRVHGQGPDEQVVIVHVGDRGPVEVARHLRATPGSPAVNDEHFPPAPAGALGRQPRPGNAAEAEFLSLGEGARTWLTEAAAAGTSRMRIKMADAVALARLGDPTAVNWALGHAAVNARFAERDLPSIITHHASAGPAGRRRPGQGGSLSQGTASWSALGAATSTAQDPR